MNEDYELQAAARALRKAAQEYLNARVDAREVDRAVELWLLEREKVRGR